VDRKGIGSYTSQAVPQKESLGLTGMVCFRELASVASVGRQPCDTVHLRVRKFVEIILKIDG
jgi:hypothetical protein